MADYTDILPTDIAVLQLDDVTHGQRNTDLDHEIGQAVARGMRPPTLRIWRSGSRTGIGVSRKDVVSEAGRFAMETLVSEGFDVVVRQTGGTAVPQGEGVLHVSIIVPRRAEAVTTDAYYRALCDPFLVWLRENGLTDVKTGELPGSYCDGTYNVLIGERKLIGTAQAWRGGLAGFASRHPGYVLAHACIAVDVDFVESTDLMNRFYVLSGSDYRVDLRTTVSLRDALPELFADSSAALANQRTAQLLYRHFVDYFDQRHIHVIPDSTR